MNLSGKTVGFALTGSFCTFSRVFPQVKALAEAGARVIPILSFNAWALNTRFYRASEVQGILQEITGEMPLHQLETVEPIGPRKLLDLLIIAPCTGNSLAKLAAGIADTPVTLAAKSHLRNERPVLLAVSTNDGLAAAAKNIGALQAAKHYYFVPYGEDAPEGKPRSLVAHFEEIPACAAAAMEGRQLQPMLK